MTKTLYIKPHTRRAPVDPFAEIKAIKTAQLREEVEDVIHRRLVSALEEAFSDDPKFVETW